MDRPNVLLLFTDQQRYDSLGAVNPVMKTPALDRLAAEGCLCENAYTPNPVCMPARANLLTGLTSRYHGYPRNYNHPMKQCLPALPEILGAAGYHTEAIGKMHFHPMRRHYGFQRMQLMEETPPYRQDDDYLLYLQRVGYGHVIHQHGVRHLLYHQPQRSILPEEHHGSRWVGDRTIEFLRTNCKQPFFLWASWIHPHPPYNIPDAWADLYAGEPIPEPIPAPKQELPPMVRDASGPGDIDIRKFPQRMRRHREAYYAACAFVDHQIGRILTELDALGLADNTLVLFTTDHGEMAGDLGTFQKSSPYEGAVHIPLLLRWPGRIAPGSRRHDFVDLNDCLPTFLDAAGVAYPGPHELPGESLLLAPGAGRKDRSVQYAENGWIAMERGGNRWAMLRDRRYKYTHFYYGNYEVLIDLAEDPRELNNLMLGELTAEQRAAHRRLRAALIEYESRWGMEDAIAGGEFVTIAPYDTGGPARRRCAALPSWPPQLKDPAEIAALNTIEQEMLAVIAEEPTVRLSDLDLAAWEAKTGLRDLAERFRMM